MKTDFTIQSILNSPCGSKNQHLQEPEKKKKSKYGNVKVFHEGEEFDSVKERSRHITNQYRQQIGEIKNLQRQVTFRLESNDKKVCDYIADNTYNLVKTGELIVEDTKSSMTRKLAPYRLKKKLMKARYNIDILEV